MPSSHADHHVSVVVLRAILAGASALGVDLGAVLEEVGLSRERLDDRRARVHQSVEEQLWRSVLRRTDEGPAIGAIGALRADRGAFGVLEYAARTAATVGDALDVLVHQSALLHGVPLFTLDLGPRTLCVQYHLPHDASQPFAPPAAELALGTIARVLREGSVGGVQPEVIELSHGPTAHNLEQLFGARVRHEQSRYALCIARRDAADPMRDADPVLHDILIDQLEGEKNEAASLGDRFEDRVRRAVEQQLLVGAPSLKQVAQIVGMAPRTLQAHLGEAGTSFRDVITSARLERAKLYLCATNMPIASVSALAGYSDERSLYRAFRRSYDTTPDAIRKAGRADRQTLDD